MTESAGASGSPPPDAPLPPAAGSSPDPGSPSGSGPAQGAPPPPGYGYGQGGSGQAGYGAPGYGAPGYGQAGYGPPGYGPPGFGAPPGYPPPVAQPYGGYTAQPYGYGRGPIGEVRSWGTTLLLALVTCGIYQIYWLYKMHEEVKEYSGQGVGGGLGLLFALICGVINYFLLPAEIEKMYQLDGQPSPISSTLGFWVFLPVAGPIIWLAKVQETANDFWRARGAIG